MPHSYIHSLIPVQSKSKVEKEVIVLASDIYGRQGLISLLTGQSAFKVKITHIEEPQEIIEECNEKTGLIIYQLLDGAMHTGILRSMVAVRAHWPNVIQVIMCDKLQEIYTYFACALGDAMYWDAKISLQTITALLKQTLNSMYGEVGQLLAGKYVTKQPFDILTLRQRSIFQLLATGLSVNAVASKLNMLPQTVRSHRYQALRRLGIPTVVEQQYLFQVLNELIAISIVGLSSPMVTLAAMDAMFIKPRCESLPVSGLALQPAVLTGGVIERGGVQINCPSETIKRFTVSPPSSSESMKSPRPPESGMTLPYKCQR